MDAYTAEAQQIEEIKKWWRENGLSVVLSLTLGVSAIFGWRYWQDVKIEQAESASVLYSEMVVALQNENGTKTRDLATGILAEYKGTTYGVFALLALANLAVADDDLDTAETHLRQALRQSKDASFSHVISLRLIRILISRNKLDEAGNLITRQEKAEYASSYDELMGDISVLQGEIETARASYQQSINKARLEGRDISTLERKLNNIGHP